MEEDVVVIRLPKLEVTASGRLNSKGLAFLRGLHESLEPLNKYKFPDGRRAIDFNLRDSLESSTFVSDEDFGRGGYPPNKDHVARGWWVMAILLPDPEDESADNEYIELYSEDFTGDAGPVKEAFKRVAEHLGKYVVPAMTLVEALGLSQPSGKRLPVGELEEIRTILKMGEGDLIYTANMEGARARIVEAWQRLGSILETGGASQ